jgi:hypothetical protein
MTISELEQLFIENKTTELFFEGYCYDCGKEVTVIASVKDNGELSISGGTVYKTEKGNPDKSNTVLKCDDCFKKEPLLKRKCEVYSRAVGYLRPISQWNLGKKQEWKNRTKFQTPKGY